MPSGAARPVVLVSNRGPVTFVPDGDGGHRAKRGAGGLVSGLAPLVTGGDATWVAAAMTDGDRAQGDGAVEAEGFRLRFVATGAETYRQAYDVVCNATLWFVHHHLFELSRRPRFDHRWAEAWGAYRTVNDAFATAVADTAPEGAAVLLQDYHLALAAPTLRRHRPDLRVVHFSHTPFAVPDLFAVLPDDVAREVLEGMAANHACGFHTERWAAAFRACCERWLGEAPPTYVSPLAPDADDLRATAASPACDEALAALDDRVGDRRLLVRVDRIELSKNLLRGFAAFDRLLERNPRWREQVVFAANVYPSRQALPEYLAYAQEVETLVAHVNDRWATGDWTPVLLDTSDDFPSSVAAMRRADAFLLNPVRDGLNLVALESALVNERGAPLVLSREAGVWDQVADAALGINPFDLEATASALDEALGMESDARHDRARLLRARALARTPAHWLDEQRRAAG